MSNSLDPGQTRHFVEPDLGPIERPQVTSGMSKTALHGHSDNVIVRLNINKINFNVASGNYVIC